VDRRDPEDAVEVGRRVALDLALADGAREREHEPGQPGTLPSSRTPPVEGPLRKSPTASTI
jgi:hypothetical protein